MIDWLFEANTAIDMQQKRAVTVETPTMTITAEMGKLTQSRMYWIDGTVDVRQPGVMQPNLPEEDRQPQLFIPLTFKGDGKVIVPGKQDMTYDASQAPRALRIEKDIILYDFKRVTKNRSFVPFVPTPTLANWFGGRLPKELIPFTVDKVDQTLDAPIQNPHLLKLLATQIDTYEPPMRDLALQGLALQMVSLFLHELCGSEGKYGSLTAREVRLAREAHEKLLADLSNPPTASELAIQIGIPEKRLDQAFREIYGMSVFQTLTNARLDHAFQALQTGEVSVKELSYRLGYKHPSSFSRAFYLRFNVYPTQLRNR